MVPRIASNTTGADVQRKNLLHSQQPREVVLERHPTGEFGFAVRGGMEYDTFPTILLSGDSLSPIVM